MPEPRAAIVGTGCSLPDRRLTNADLEGMVETTDQWILERTGIRQRRIAAPEETTSTFAIAAARLALSDARLRADELDLILVATVTPDYPFPATACLVQEAIGAKGAACCDLQAACSGFLYGTSLAAGMIASGHMRNILLIGAETLSRVVDYSDRSTCILFGDGAGAAVFAPRSDGSGVRYCHLAADGSMAEVIRIPAGGSKLPASCQTVTQRQHYMQVDGRKVFKFATSTFIDLVQQAMRACELSRDDVALVIPHQVNERIIEAAMKKLDLPPEKFFVNIQDYGNTSAASVPIALDEARRQGRLKAGDTAILLAFGAGLTWGSAVVRF